MEEKILELEAIIKFLIENNPDIKLPTEEEKTAIIEHIRAYSSRNDDHKHEW